MFLILLGTTLLGLGMFIMTTIATTTTELRHQEKCAFLEMAHFAISVVTVLATKHVACCLIS